MPRSRRPPAALLDSTIGAVAGALVCALFDPHFVLMPSWPAHLWLVLLALVSQVTGWLLIADGAAAAAVGGDVDHAARAADADRDLGSVDFR